MSFSLYEGVSQLVVHLDFYGLLQAFGNKTNRNHSIEVDHPNQNLLRVSSSDFPVH